MGSGLVNVREWHTGIEVSRDERVAQRVRADPLLDPAP